MEAYKISNFLSRSNWLRGNIACLLVPWLYGPLRTSASFMTDAYSSLFWAFFLHLLAFINIKSFSTSSSHLNLGLPTFLLSSGLLSKTFLTTLHWSILVTCPNHSSRFMFISTTKSGALYSSLNSFLLILYIPCSVTGPYTFLRIFLSHILALFYPSLSWVMLHIQTSQLALI
jgi:hypothetical protein